MGSKRSLLNNGLGHLLITETNNHRRFIDLFSGSASVSWFVATNAIIPVYAFDLQHYSMILNNSVLKRIQPLPIALFNSWLEESYMLFKSSYIANIIERIEGEEFSAHTVKKSKEICQSYLNDGPIFNSYGGYYYSPSQALYMDCFLKCIPQEEPLHQIALAAMISAANHCAASPGHTAQPLRPTENGIKHIETAWKKDIKKYIEESLRTICSLHARMRGEGFVDDAVNVSSSFLRDGDLVFIDPPYSDVQYSRFYHVLETISHNIKIKVSGEGRYPAFEKRPQSLFSLRSKATETMNILLKKLAKKDITVVITFPDKIASNGLSCDIIIKLAQKYFFKDCEKTLYESRFSTLGGHKNTYRPARTRANEAILILRK